MRKLLYRLARRIVASRMEEGTQLTSNHLEKNGWVYRDGYFVDPKANDEKRVYIKFQAGDRYDKTHYYKAYHCSQISSEDGERVATADPDILTLFARESSVEWLETHLLCINKKPERLI